MPPKHVIYAAGHQRGFESAPIRGTGGGRVGIGEANRFSLCVRVLGFLQPSLDRPRLVPGRIPGAHFFRNLWRAIVPWVATGVFHLSGPVVQYRPTGSGDTTLDYVQTLCFFVGATLAAILWSAGCIGFLAGQPRISLDQRGSVQPLAAPVAGGHQLVDIDQIGGIVAGVAGIAVILALVLNRFP